MKRLYSIFTVLLAVGSVLWAEGTTRAQSGTPELRVAAAADLANAFKEMGALFEKESGAKVTVVLGSTGLLAKQVENGAPFDLLFAADETFLTDLEKKGRVVPHTRRLYAIGRLTIWTRKDAPLPKSLADLADPAYHHIAIANPEHAPYGAAAREALQKANVWKSVEPRLVYGENIQQTLQYAQTGNADVALVALSLAIGSEGHWTLVPDKLHHPLRQAVGLLTSSTNQPLARRFVAFVNGPKGRPIMRRFGFLLPGEKNREIR